METSFRLVLTTTGSEEAAEALARALVERGLAACVSVVGPITSFYRWNGAIERDAERLLLIKTSVQRLDELGAAIRELHTYEVPEMLVLPIVGGDAAYLAWLGNSLVIR